MSGKGSGLGVFKQRVPCRRGCTVGASEIGEGEGSDEDEDDVKLGVEGIGFCRLLEDFF